MDNQLILIRGLPGSGKSTLAKQYADRRDSRFVHLEADMFFLDKCGVYQFDAKKLTQAHQWCLSMTRQALLTGSSVVVSNTFVQLWEMKPYLLVAKELDIEFDVLVCRNNYGSTHNVPLKTIDLMRKKWQENRE